MFDPYVPVLTSVNTVICEQSFAWSNQYSNVKSMNGPRFNHFFHYLLDLHNLRVEGVLRQIANPHSEKRMELIWEKLTATMAKSETIVENKNEDEDENENEDEVSCMYYEDHCSCSKAAKCKSKK